MGLIMFCRIYVIGGGEARGLASDSAVLYPPPGDDGWFIPVELPCGYFANNLNYTGKSNLINPRPKPGFS
jgi:hypothetical protein